jgi:hypothetical protein
MPGFLLANGAVVQCVHDGEAMPVAPSPRVMLGGQPAVTVAGGYVIAGCAEPPPPAGNGPCLTATFVTAAKRVRIMGQPALLQDSRSICQPTGTPLLIGATQRRVAGI